MTTVSDRNIEVPERLNFDGDPPSWVVPANHPAASGSWYETHDAHDLDDDPAAVRVAFELADAVYDDDAAIELFIELESGQLSDTWDSGCASGSVCVTLVGAHEPDEFRFGRWNPGTRHHWVLLLSPMGPGVVIN